MKPLRLRNSCKVCERKTRDVHGQGRSNLNLALFVCSFDVCRSSLPFPSFRKRSVQQCGDRLKKKTTCGLTTILLFSKLQVSVVHNFTNNNFTKEQRILGHKGG